MNTRKMIASALGAALLVSALPGMALAQDEAAEPIGVSPEGIDWVLGTIAGDAVPEGVEVTLVMSGGEVVGTAGCNSYFGSYEIDDSSLSFPDPLGITLRLCEDEVMAVEGAYLPLLQETASWSIDESGALSLADADGEVQLVYAEAVIDVTVSAAEALVATLGDLQAQVDVASDELDEIVAAIDSVNINKIRNRISETEQRVEALEERTKGLNVEGMKGRISELEKTAVEQQSKIAEINVTINKLRNRIRVLEGTVQDHEARLAALEGEGSTPASNG